MYRLNGLIRMSASTKNELYHRRIFPLFFFDLDDAKKKCVRVYDDDDDDDATRGSQVGQADGDA